MTKKLYIVFMKWGSLYNADYVNRLYNAINANTNHELQFICLTDESGGIHSNIDCRAIPDYGIPHEKWYDGAWPKLSVFGDVLDDLVGRALFVDLDTVICGNIDSFFELEGGLVMIDGGANWVAPSNPGPASPMSSIFAFTPGEQRAMFDEFMADQSKVYNTFRLEQDFVGARATGVRFWPKGWIVSFKRHLRQPLLLDLFLYPKKPTGTTKAIAFHGDPRPVDLLKRRWWKFPHSVKGPVPWFKEYWDKYS